MNKKLIIGLIFSIFVLLISTSVYFYNQKFSISDIDADNYRDKLLINNWKNRIKVDDSETLSLKLLRGDNPDKIDLAYTWQLDNLDRYNFSLNKTKGENGRVLVELGDKNSPGNFYNVYFNSNMLPIGCIVNLSKGFVFKNLIDKMILEEGFVLKKSTQIKGHDIIIKEDNNSFIIGELFIKYDDLEKNEFSMYNLIIHLYSKKKYI